MQSSNPMNFPFTLAPMGSQQFYNMAQNHAMVNSAYPVPAPAYVPCTEDAGYRPAPYYHPASSVNTSSNLPMNAVYVPSHDHSGWNWPCDSLPVHLSMEAVDTNDFIRAAHEAMSPRRLDGISPRGLNTGFGIYESLPQNVPASAPVQAASDAASHEVENISDDALPDGYKWRKYGQKQVKGSVYPRNYYKCTIPGCSAKRHLEKFFDAHLNKERLRTIYLGEHVHPTPVSPHLFVTDQQDFRSNVFTQSNKIRQMSQEAAWDRVKGEATDAERLVVECLAHVDENEDGYFWRKYGQKTVKGSFAPRQYYRCRNADCRVKKQVEASPAGNTVVTYEGVHNHEPGDCPDNVSSHSDYQQVSYTDNLTKVVDLPPVSNRAKREYVESSYPHMDSPSSSISTTEDDGSSVSSDVPSSNKRIKYEESDPVLHYLCELPPSKEELVWDCSSFGHHDLNPRYVTEFFLETIAQE